MVRVFKWSKQNVDIDGTNKIRWMERLNIISNPVYKTFRVCQVRLYFFINNLDNSLQLL